tara:strand:+ start:537 stop:2387 length:1851 start_codon:yes stop_codon:yes gene_type:complete
MAQDIQKKVKKEKERNYLSKDFDGFRAELLSYAKTYFPDKIKDFSEGSVGGLFLDMAAFVGDSLSFYLDHQFNELNALTAVEPSNVVRHLRSAGVPIAGASPASADVTFSIIVPAETAPDGQKRPMEDALPVIEIGTRISANNGIIFNLVDELDFRKKDPFGDVKATSQVLTVDSNGLPMSYTLSLVGTCVSGNESIYTINIPNSHVPFRRIPLPHPNITEVISVVDSNLNQYYEVNSLSQDVVYGGSPTIGKDGEIVKQQMEIIPAPRRFMVLTDPLDRTTKLVFGGGDADTLDDDIIPDPSELALPLFGKKTFSRFVIDPNSLLKSQTLGFSPKNTTLRIKYRHGGGLSHNADPGAINTIVQLGFTFKNIVDPVIGEQVKNSVSANNETNAVGGLPAPTLEELRAQIPQARQMQSRMVSKADTLARIYTLPTTFGRVYRAAISSNPNNMLAANLHVICKNQQHHLVPATDALKKNLSTYLNEFRLVSDAMDILDARVLNFAVSFSIVSNPSANKQLVIQQVAKRLKGILTVDNFQINQPIVLSDIVNIIVNTQGVISMVELPRITARYGIIDGRNYDNVTFTPRNLEVRGMIVPPAGSIFQLKFPDFDILGTSA